MPEILEDRLGREDLLAMSVEERIFFVEVICETLAPEDFEVATRQDEEARRRLETFDADKLNGRSWDVVLEEIGRNPK
jgi:putative addiction module component (TIGR02574 family)